MNNEGIATGPGSMESEWEKTLNVNLMGAVRWCDAVLPPMKDVRLAGLDPYNASLEYYRPLTPLGRPQSADDVGKAVAFLCSDDAANITGQCLHVDGGAVIS